MRYNYAAEARDEHLTKLDNALYIIITLVNIKTRKYLSKTNEVRSKAGEVPEFFLFPKRDISTARCKCTIYIFTYKSIKVVIRTEFINMTVFLSMWPFFCFVLFCFHFGRICDLCFSQKCWKSVYS